MPEYIYGISSQFNDYQLAWEINKLINIELAKSTSNYFENKLGEVSLETILYSYKDSDDDYYYLIKNKYAGFNLIPKLNRFDYIFILEKKNDDLIRILTQKSESKIILGCFNIILTLSQLNIVKKILLK